VCNASASIDLKIMTKETLASDLIEASKALVELAKEICWNEISDDYLYILTEIQNSSDNFEVQQKRRALENSKKIPGKMQSVILELEILYSNIYDINLHIYEAQSDKTIIEIRYFVKSSLDPAYEEKVIDTSPMLHCKVAHPPSLQEGEKFDVNWESKILA
jgi:hypothetical protein